MLSLHTKNVQSPRSSATAARTPCIEASHGWNEVRLSHRKHVDGKLRGSVMITDEDAAITSRRVSLNEQISGRSSDRPPSLGDQFGKQGSIGANAAEIAKRVRNRVLAKGSTWTVPKPDISGQLGMGSLTYLVTDEELLLLCENAVRNKLWSDTSCVSVQVPVKVFGDIHGQFQDLLRFFDEYVAPEPYSGDIGYVHYLFLGDYVDRGTLSLEVIALLLALKTTPSASRCCAATTRTGRSMRTLASTTNAFGAAPVESKCGRRATRFSTGCPSLPSSTTASSAYMAASVAR